MVFLLFQDLPFQVVEELQWWSGAIVALVSFVLFGIEEIANEIENPFGYDANDLPLDEICTTMLHNIEDLSVIDDSDHIPMAMSNQLSDFPIPLSDFSSGNS